MSKNVMFSFFFFMWRCAIPDLTNDTYKVQSENHAKLIKEYIPEEMVEGEPAYSKCHLYVNKSLPRNQTLSNCNSWVYDKSIFQKTITSDVSISDIFNNYSYRQKFNHHF